jgi:hypothetical protein
MRARNCRSDAAESPDMSVDASTSGLELWYCI